MPFGIQPIHIVIILIVAFLLFGTSKLPEMGRSLGKTISEFKQGTKEAAEGFREETHKNSAAPATPASAAQASPLPPAAASSSSLSRSFCIQCGAPNPAEARFCASCGAKLPEKTA
jgi:sec-independent protein translocase protein TatA